MVNSTADVNAKKQRFLVAKYTPDVRRLEPRNIGIILWTPRRLGLRFLETTDAKFVKDKGMYDRWVTFWSDTCQSKVIEVGRGQEVAANSPDFVEALLNTQRGQYRLVDGGFVPEKVLVNDIDRMTDTLFSDLVATPTMRKDAMDDVSSGTLLSRCKDLFQQIGLSDREDFFTARKVRCQVGKITRDFQANYLVGNPSRHPVILQRVEIGEPRSVDSTSFMFERLLEKGVVEGKNKLAALYHDPNSDGAMIDQLSEYSIPINLSDRDASRLIRGIVG